MRVYHYRKPALCRVPNALPSAKHRALGKVAVCWVPHSAKTKHTVNSSFTERRALGKEYFAECRALGKGWHSANRRQEVTVGHAVTVCRVFGPRHSAKRACAECRGQTLGKIYKFFSLISLKFFLLSSYSLLNKICNLGSFIQVFAIFR
jgi:hypothetical protein